jgi:Protein of unknown function (DUF3313)
MFNNIVRYGATAAVACSLALPAFAADGGLVRVRASGFHEAFAAGGALPSGFKSVYIAPVGAGSSRSLSDLGPRDIKYMEGYLGDELKDRLGARFTLANRPGPGTLVVQAVFTDLQSNQLTVDQLKKRPELDPVRTRNNGHAGIEITLTDGGSNATLATLSDYEEGWPIGGPQSHTIWGTAQQISSQWARDLADLLSGR